MEQKVNYKEQVDRHINIRINKEKQSMIILKFGIVFLVLFLILFLFNLISDTRKEYLTDIYFYRIILIVFVSAIISFVISYILSEKAYKLQEEHLRIEKNSVFK
jgi:uncharacterized membrane protein